MTAASLGSLIGSGVTIGAARHCMRLAAGFLHRETELDTLGLDQPETKCKLN